MIVHNHHHRPICYLPPGEGRGVRTALKAGPEQDRLAGSQLQGRGRAVAA